MAFERFGPERKQQDKRRQEPDRWRKQALLKKCAAAHFFSETYFLTQLLKILMK
mgnify:CR=1 FL=1